jgi:hypothetical protein
MTAQLVKMAAVRRVHEKIHAESADSRLYGRPLTVIIDREKTGLGFDRTVCFQQGRVHCFYKTSWKKGSFTQLPFYFCSIFSSFFSS